jgi:hypothetical protein
MERRKFLIGAGSLAAGSAAAVGTGAFTSVEADRSLSIAVAGDASAFLSINRATDSDGDVYPNANEYVEGDLSSDSMSLNFTNSDNTDGSASGVNKNAKTVFDNLLDVTNNGTQDVEFSIVTDLVASNGGSLGIYAENTLDDGGSDNVGFDYADSDGDGNAEPAKVTLSPGDSVTNIGVYVPKGNSVDSLSGGTLTFKAVRVGGNLD